LHRRGIIEIDPVLPIDRGQFSKNGPLNNRFCAMFLLAAAASLFDTHPEKNVIRVSSAQHTARSGMTATQ
jgi:hypothetical protein